MVALSVLGVSLRTVSAVICPPSVTPDYNCNTNHLKVYEQNLKVSLFQRHDDPAAEQTQHHGLQTELRLQARAAGHGGGAGAGQGGQQRGGGLLQPPLHHRPRQPQERGRHTQR